MKVLVATSQTQGERADDYHWCVDGELVWIQEPCQRDRTRAVNSCGCGRGYAGLASHRATTTAKVQDLVNLTMEEYILAMRSSFDHSGWPVDLAEVVAREQAGFCESWPNGTVLERDLDDFAPRRILR